MNAPTGKQLDEETTDACPAVQSLPLNPDPVAAKWPASWFASPNGNDLNQTRAREAERSE
jgi:hypothetical protein